MLLSELHTNDKVLLQVKVKDQEFKFNSKVVLVKEKFILIEPVRMKGKIVNFGTGPCVVDFLLEKDGQPPVMWQVVRLKNVTYKDQVYYQVDNNIQGREVNRREAFRIYVGADGIAQLGLNKKTVDVIVKDVSETGFAFVSQENVEEIEKYPVRINFTDMNHQINVAGQIVRKDSVDSGKIVYGCQILQINGRLGQYINEKQREVLYKKNARDNSRKVLKNRQNTDEDLTIKSDFATKKSIVSLGRDERRDAFKKKRLMEELELRK